MIGGASNYYKAIKQGVRVAKEQKARKVEEARLAEIKKKRIERAKRRKDAYKARKREERIAEMAEAQVRAQKMYETMRLQQLPITLLAINIISNLPWGVLNFPLSHRCLSITIQL